MDKKPVILVTRPDADFRRTQAALDDLGFVAMHAPMMRYAAKTFKAPKLRGLDALIFTSANGLRAVEASERYRQLPCYVVGKQTHKIAIELGFEVLAVGGGNVESLRDAIEKDYIARGFSKPLLHISGVHMAGNLVKKLAALEIKVERIQAYEMVEIDEISDDVEQAIKTENIGAILFYSARSAKIFIENMRKKQLIEKILDIPVFCLSKNIAEAVCKPYLKKIHYIDQPDEAELLNLVHLKL